MTSRSSYFPSHSTPLCAAHRHWLVQDGAEKPDLQASLTNLTLYARALAQPLPSDISLAPYWFDSCRFQTASTALLTHFGRESPDNLISKEDAGRDGMKTWRLDVAGMQRATGVVWPEWSQWADTVEGAMPRMIDYCRSVGLTPPDWFQLFWESAIDVRRHIGYRLRVVEELDGRTFWDDFVGGLEAYPGRLEKADRLAQRLSTSNMLSELLTSGAITSEGMLIWLKPFRRDKYPLMRFLGMEPASKEANLWDSYEWGFWEQPLVREAVRLRGLRTDFLVQSPYLDSFPVDGKSEVYWAALKVAMTVRSARQNVGVKLLEDKMRKCNADLMYDGDETQTSPLDQVYLRRETDRIAEVRDVVLESIVKLQKGIMEEATLDSRPTRIQSEELPTFLILNSRQWFKGPQHTGTTSTMEVTDEDENEAEIGEPGTLLGEMPTDSNTVAPPPDAAVPASLSVWTNAVRLDIDKPMSSKSDALYRLTSAIVLQIESGKEEDVSRPSGKDVKWMGLGLAEGTRSRLEREGFTGLRDVRGFGRESVLDGYFSMGRLIELYKDIAPSSAIVDVISSLSVWLAAAFISDYPWLYPSSGGHIIDDICGKLAAGQYGPYGERCPALFSAIGEIADGIFISASIGSRTSGDGDCIYGTPTTWIRNLIFPESCLRGLPFGLGHRLQCSACFEDHVEISSDQRNSGQRGEIRSVNLKDRLSISVFCVRRGTAFDIMRTTGRTSAYDCLAYFLGSFFHPSFIITFLYFASVIHMRDKARRGKYTVILGKDGYQLL